MSTERRGPLPTRVPAQHYALTTEIQRHVGGDPGRRT